MAPHGIEVLTAGVTQGLADLGSLLEGSAHLRVLDVEDLQGAGRPLVAGLLVEELGVRVQPLVQPLHVGGPAVCIADRVQEQLVLGDADGPEQFRIELDHLRVDDRVAASDHLERQLVVLAVAAPAGAAVAIHRREGVELDRLRLLEETVLHVGACDRGGALRTKRQRAIAPVGKGVHLLVHDVGGLT